MGTEQAAEQPLDQVEQSELGHTGSKQNGEDAESWVKDQYDLADQDESICPTAAHDAVDPRTGTPIEIKSCQVRYNGSGQRGRFQIWDYAHELLKAHGGAYIFVVHEPRTEHFHVYFHRPLSAAAVEEAVASWHAIDHKLRPDDAHRTEVSQSAVFSDIEVSRIEPEDTEEDADADHEPGEHEQKPQVERMKATKDTIREIEEQHEEDLAPHAVVVQQLEEQGLSQEQIDHHIDHLKKRGEIYQPRDGAYRVT